VKMTPAEMRQPAGKSTRVRIRLKHSLAAGEEIHAMLPDTLERFEVALARGDLKELGARLNAQSSARVCGDDV